MRALRLGMKALLRPQNQLLKTLLDDVLVLDSAPLWRSVFGIIADLLKLKEPR